MQAGRVISSLFADRTGALGVFRLGENEQIIQLSEFQPNNLEIGSTKSNTTPKRR